MVELIGWRTYPFTAFNFSVEIHREGDAKALCSAAFAECDGLEMTMEVKTIRQGGDNARQIRLAGPTAYGQLTLKRGMTSSFDLWEWFQETQQDPSLRADAAVVMLDADGLMERARFLLERCVPIRLKVPALNAKDGLIAVEELQVAYETLTLKRPPTLPGGIG